MINKFKGKYRFLSNFYETDFIYNKRRWISSEHAYQAAKAKDHDVNGYLSERIRVLPYPEQAKRYANKIELREDWNKVKDKIMYKILTCKFHQNDDLKQLLIKTGTEEIVEGNQWHDKYWGVCYCSRCNGTGSNKLGKLLMRVREDLVRGKDDGMIIHTSNFNKWKKVPGPVAISLSVPKGFDGVRLYLLAPTWEMVKAHKKRKGTFSFTKWDMEYTKKYYQLMTTRKIQSKWIVDQLREIGEEVTLLCYEKPEDFCHRHLVAYWLNKQLDMNIKEIL